MTIVDTSIWIEFFKGNVSYFDVIRTEIEHLKILACEPVFAELLQGVKNRREKQIIEQYWRFLPKAEIEDCWIKAGILSSERKLLSYGVGLIDSCILMMSIETNSKIWSLDKKLLKVVPPELIYIPSADE